MQSHHSSFGPLSADQLAALVGILEEFKDEPLSRALLILAYRLARLEAAQ